MTTPIQIPAFVTHRTAGNKRNPKVTLECLDQLAGPRDGLFLEVQEGEREEVEFFYRTHRPSDFA
jgi:hypothetical protein